MPYLYIAEKPKMGKAQKKSVNDGSVFGVLRIENGAPTRTWGSGLGLELPSSTPREMQSALNFREDSNSPRATGDVVFQGMRAIHGDVNAICRRQIGK